MRRAYISAAALAGGKGGGWRASAFAADQKLCQIVARGKPPSAKHPRRRSFMIRS